MTQAQSEYQLVGVTGSSLADAAGRMTGPERDGRVYGRYATLAGAEAAMRQLLRRSPTLRGGIAIMPYDPQP
jgi:hypothetical protein